MKYFQKYSIIEQCIISWKFCLSAHSFFLFHKEKEAEYEKRKDRNVDKIVDTVMYHQIFLFTYKEIMDRKIIVKVLKGIKSTLEKKKNNILCKEKKP